MNLNHRLSGSPWTIYPRIACGLALAALICTQTFVAHAQSEDAKPSENKPASEPKQPREPTQYQTIYLANASQQNDLTDIQTAIRNIVSNVRVYGIPSQNAISIRGTAEDIALAQKVVADLDRPKKIYRLTFTIADTDSGKRIGTQNFALIVASGEKTTLKQGGRVPIVTGGYKADEASQHMEVQYLDVGLNIEAWVEGFDGGVRLRSKIEQSSLSDERSGVGAQDPIVHQSVVDGIATLALGKPLILGSLAIPGSTQAKDVQVVAELVK
ncbi:MAG: secretin N-terminal domain-containing protein [Terracidiphilus sp.]|jgi:type II secretory pathway component GspD/PulD (secretin)